MNIKSHRARAMFTGFLGRKPQDWVYTTSQDTWPFIVGHHVVDVTRAEWDRFQAEKKSHRSYWHGSVTRARLPGGVDRTDLSRSWGG